MTDLATTSDARPDIDGDAVDVAAAPQPALITEQEVLLGSAAALAGPKVRRNYLAMMRATFTSGIRSDVLVKPKDHPRRHAFIEDALMARMMDRL